MSPAALNSLRGTNDMIIVYLICYAASFLLERLGIYWLSGLVLIGAAIALYVYDYRRTGNLIHLRAVFSLFWVGGQGVACLKLSNLSSPWSGMTWLCFLAAFGGFWGVYELMERLQGESGGQSLRWFRLQSYERPLFFSMIIITAASVVSFAIEAAVLGFIPMFVEDMPHAYSYFHISGLHYFTVSCVLVPALSVIYFLVERGRNERKLAAAVVMDGVSLLVPILCVSRFQLILAVALAVFTFIAMEKKIKPGILIGIVVCMIPLYVLLTVARGHDVEYLNGIFEMKNRSIPIFITQPYMYIANNYENFNCLVEQLPSHTFGLRSLFPLWALTGLKFIFPSLVSFPLYVTKTELTTVTLFYDAFYDFGLFGVLVFSCLLGLISFYLVRMIKGVHNPVGYLFYSQVALYLMLSFFTTWFSNPATWFYLAATGAVYLFCELGSRGTHGYGRRRRRWKKRIFG